MDIEIQSTKAKCTLKISSTAYLKTNKALS
jgi:hypothetical protein